MLSRYIYETNFLATFQNLIIIIYKIILKYKFYRILHVRKNLPNKQMDYWENDNDTVEIITSSKNEPCNLHLISFLTNLFDNKMAILKVITWALNIYIYDNFFVPYLLQQHDRYPEKEYKLLKKLSFWKKIVVIYYMIIMFQRLC